MARRLGTWMTAWGACALLVFSACSEGSDPGGDGDGDGDGDGAGGSGDGDGDGAGGSGDGDGDMGGGSGEAMIRYGFDSDLEGLYVGWEEPADWSSWMGMGGGTSKSGLEWIDTEGDPDDGAAELTIEFENYTGTTMNADLRKVQINIDLASPVDMSDTSISVQLKLISGGSEECPVNAKVFSKGEGYIWGDGGTINLVEGSWETASMTPSAPSYTDDGYDESAIVQFGIELSPSNAETCTTDTVVVAIDSISY